MFHARTQFALNVKTYFLGKRITIFQNAIYLNFTRRVKHKIEHIYEHQNKLIKSWERVLITCANRKIHQRRIADNWWPFFNIIIEVLKTKPTLHPKRWQFPCQSHTTRYVTSDTKLISHFTAVRAFLRTIASHCHLDMPLYNSMEWLSQSLNS